MQTSTPDRRVSTTDTTGVHRFVEDTRARIGGIPGRTGSSHECRLVVAETARPIEEFLARRPQAGRRRGDEIEPLAVGRRVPALFAVVGAVAGDRLVDIGVAEVDAFDFRLRTDGRART